MNESTTETLTVTLPAAIVRRIRERVSAGQFASESALIEHDVTKADEWAGFPNEPSGESLDEWEARVVKEYHASVAAGTHKSSPVDTRRVP